ncbi:hypothetical protein DICA1_B08856 [Diutina catenulata]
MSYPSYVDGKPPTISLSQYDEAEWADTTCMDHRNNQYVVVDMQEPSKVVAFIQKSDYEVLDKIFASANQKFAAGDVTKQ